MDISDATNEELLKELLKREKSGIKNPISTIYKKIPLTVTVNQRYSWPKIITILVERNTEKEITKEIDKRFPEMRGKYTYSTTHNNNNLKYYYNNN
jgi:hypothetical protein